MCETISLFIPIPVYMLIQVQMVNHRTNVCCCPVNSASFALPTCHSSSSQPDWSYPSFELVSDFSSLDSQFLNLFLSFIIFFLSFSCSPFSSCSSILFQPCVSLFSSLFCALFEGLFCRFYEVLPSFARFPTTFFYSTLHLVRRLVQFVCMTPALRLCILFWFLRSSSLYFFMTRHMSRCCATCNDTNCRNTEEAEKQMDVQDSSGHWTRAARPTTHLARLLAPTMVVGQVASAGPYRRQLLQ